MPIRSHDDFEPIRGVTGPEELRRVDRTGHLATGTLACPECDAPVVPPGPVAPSAAIACPFCLRSGFVRDFLSLTPPTRPTRVVVRVVTQPLPARRFTSA